MGPKHNLVQFKSLWWYLFIKSWSSFTHPMLGKDVMVTPSLPSHLAMHCRWFSLYCPLGRISLVVKMSTTRMKLWNHCVGLALVTSYWPMPELFNRPGVINEAYPVWFFIVVGFCRTVNTSIEKQGQVAVTVLEKFLKSKLQQNRTSTARQAVLHSLNS